ncbi:MAG: hypothetical protein A2252_02330 [Elusimicrobia bacterium RIFOXYA2_FULL_39_19]|nr:MAG: hypothetical protein A2252_02330 [Elusimicrobia bacterium RIFOXYA2_FULL_39_19]
MSKTNKSGTIIILPKKVVAGTVNTYTFIYTAGKGGIKENGSIRIFFHGEHSWAKPQVFHVGHYPGYVSVTCSNGKVAVTPRLISTSLAEYGKPVDYQRYINSGYSGYSLQISITGASLAEGDRIKIVFGDIQNGKGFGAVCGHKVNPYIKRNEQAVFVTAVDNTGTGKFIELENSPELEIIPDKTAGFEVIGPSVAEVGEMFTLHIKARDRFYNATPDYSGVLKLTIAKKGLILPVKVQFIKNSLGTLLIKDIKAVEAGVYRISVIDEKTGIAGESYPVKVVKEKQYGIYWGDLHHHTGWSYDVVGPTGRITAPPVDTCRYARDIAASDFIAITDHHTVLDCQWTSPEEKKYAPLAWAPGVEAVKKLNKDGKFIVYMGMEFEDGRGHTNVIFLNDNPPYCKDKIQTIEDVWKFYNYKDIISIPHFHADWGVPKRWKAPVNEKIECLAEIASVFGRFEHMGNVPRYPRWMKNKYCNVQHHLGEGKKIGICCGSDNHMRQPGDLHLTAVIAKDKTKKSIFEALQNRHCYGTTHPRIFIDFKLNGHIMGDVIKSDENSNIREIEAEVLGSSKILRLDIIKNNKEIYSLFNQGRDIKFKLTDAGAKKDTKSDFYYLRILQDDNEMAWTSPIWVDVKNNAKRQTKI